MTTCATSLQLRKSDPRPKNRVVGLGGFTYSCTWSTWSQTPELHQEIETQSTTTVSGVFCWLSKDPIGLSGGLNLYAYCANDPVNRRDPLGLDDLIIIHAEQSHAWIETVDLDTGERHTYGRWMQGYGGAAESGVAIDIELKQNRASHANRWRVVEDAVIPVTPGYSERYNNCTTYASDVWRQNTGEILRTRDRSNLWLWDDPGILTESVRNMNRERPNREPRPQPTPKPET